MFLPPRNADERKLVVTESQLLRPKRQSDVADDLEQPSIGFRRTWSGVVCVVVDQAAKPCGPEKCRGRPEHQTQPGTVGAGRGDAQDQGL